MKVGAIGSTFNLGDTSFRRKTLMADYKELLPILHEFKKEYPIWESTTQTFFYNTVINKTNLFDRQRTGDLAKRGRTLTNALLKPGLVNESRDLGEAAINWIEGTSKSFDTFESWLSLTVDNIVFLRQLLKLRVYDADEKNYFYPFRFTLKFLCSYENVPERNLLRILHLINPSWNQEKLNDIIEKYQKVEKSEESFEAYLANFYNDLFDSSVIDKVNELFSEDSVSEKEFSNFFPNRKSSITQKIYYEFYLKLEIYKNDRTLENLKALLEISRDPKIKKAFGFNNNVFKDAKSPQEFDEQNSESLLGMEKINFYYKFIKSKREDLVSEYSDMTKRTFNLTGIFNFSNSLVNLVYKNLFEETIKEMEEDYQMTGNSDYNSYEKNLDSSFYKDLTTTDILNLSKDKLHNISGNLKVKMNIESIALLPEIFIKEKERKMKEMIKSDFPKTKVVELLNLLIKRDSKKEQQLKNYISDSATVPTIFEYLLGIAWFYLSDEDYSVSDSMNLSLDGNLRPLTHAPGGNGDIEINYPSMAILIEATLMDKNAQKRGELEPVIRHASNLALEKTTEKTLAFFIADELDLNVVNIFRAMKFVELESTQKRNNFVQGVSIFSFKISEVIELLNKEVKHNKIVEEVKRGYSNQLDFKNRDWREEIYKKIVGEV